MNPWMFNALYMSTDTPEILDRLLACGGRDDVNTACGERHEVPLHLAAVIGSTHATLSLLSVGANINARTIYDENALWLATWRGHPEVSHRPLYAYRPFKVPLCRRLFKFEKLNLRNVTETEPRTRDLYSAAGELATIGHSESITIIINILTLPIHYLAQLILSIS